MPVSAGAAAAAAAARYAAAVLCTLCEGRAHFTRVSWAAKGKRGERTTREREAGAVC